MISALFLGLGLGLGLWSLIVWAYPPRPSLRTALARATSSPHPINASTSHISKLAAPLQAWGLPGERVLHDLAVIGRPPDVHLAEKASLAMTGATVPVLVQGLLIAADAGVDLTFPLVAGSVLATAGFFLPDLRVRAAATLRRTEFRHALSSYLDLVWIALAGGAGVTSALRDSAEVGRGWAFSQIQHALNAAMLTRSTPWTKLRQLGEELGVSELAELASSASLAGSEGAKVRASLAAKAAALRAHQLSHEEANAQSATERMSLPVMLLLLGFLAFITYPAATQVLNGL
ncbi:type II secretion system F family protein [Lentzea sp. JNUCC 0626]|uniref:type II secretion system F family protein n=1 Tax=Lentzea sp. JNUCC 0626 TaxID=3367513 RepID=UPI003749C332